MKPRDAIKLASSLNEIAEQPIREEEHQTKREKNNYQLMAFHSSAKAFQNRLIALILQIPIKLKRTWPTIKPTLNLLLPFTIE